MHKTDILISVVIPAHNEERVIADCLTSLREQTYTNGVEIIVVDNNSTDSTADAARAHGATVYVEPKEGVCFARQRGTKEALGRIVVSADADTTYPYDWLRNIADAFLDNPDAVAVAGPCIFVKAPWWGGLYYNSLFGIVNFIFKLTGRLIFIPASNIAFKKEAWSGYDTTLRRGGDEFALLSQLKKAGRVLFLYNNPVFTSSRRLEKGILFNLLVTAKKRYTSYLQFVFSSKS